MEAVIMTRICQHCGNGIKYQIIDRKHQIQGNQHGTTNTPTDVLRISTSSSTIYAYCPYCGLAEGWSLED